jgi:hypothetical protein
MQHALASESLQSVWFSFIYQFDSEVAEQFLEQFWMFRVNRHDSLGLDFVDDSRQVVGLTVS